MSSQKYGAKLFKASYFGAKCSFVFRRQKSKDSESCSVNNKARYPLINIPPSWQRVTDSLYVYSAYWMEDDGYVKTVAVDSSISADSLFCSLWYADIPQPSKGSVAVESEELRGTGFLYIHCKPSHVNIGIPIATSFYLEKDSSLGVKIPVLRSYHAGHSHNVSVIICTTPEYVTNSEAIGHLAYHQLIGVTSFIIYGQPQFQGVNVVNVPWNFPFPERQRISPAIEADCVLRARAAGATYAIALSWNEYLVPRYHRSLHSLFTEYSGSEKSIGFEIMRVDFCTEFNNSREGLNYLDMLPLRKTHRKAEKSMKYVSVHSTSEHSGDKQKISENIISLHQYVSCFKNKRFRKGRIVQDPVFHRFDLDLKDALTFWLSRDVMPET
ncbi:hypothetical protein J437_LFUL003973 [Ladona fulva]|uniref:Glycosyltransferase family 92 protein n=1 Tax=Ladona fulva TaxID=123851 RepID=A0A8K0NZA3_LADFU|nr:hypothetical protein J437_LFUL003973 [Ladona fulva]